MATNLPALGVVATVIGFDPKAKTPGGEYRYLEFARGLRSRTDRFSRFSMPMSPDQEFVDLAHSIHDQTGYEIVPIVLVQEATNPADRSVERAAIDNLVEHWKYALLAGARQTMGPTGEPWQPGAQTWGKLDLSPLPGAIVAGRTAQSAKVHALAMSSAVPEGAVFKHCIEYLFNGEQATFNTLNAAGSLAAEANLRLGNTRFAVTHDTAHRYPDRRLETDELDALLAEDAKVQQTGLIGLLHCSRPRKRSHPLKGPAPMEAHFKAQWWAGYNGPIDIELFDYTDGQGFLNNLLPEFVGGNPGFDINDPWTPHIEAAAALDRWFNDCE